MSTQDKINNNAKTINKLRESKRSGLNDALIRDLLLKRHQLFSQLRGPR